jgi:hypothetical protein
MFPHFVNSLGQNCLSKRVDLARKLLVRFSTVILVSATALASSAGAVTITISVAPTTATVASGSKLKFAATVINATQQQVTWSASRGTISNTGLFVAPTVSVQTSATVTATSIAFPTIKSTVTVTVTPVLTMGTSPMSQITKGVPFSVSLTSSGGAIPYTWTISAGTLPSGVTLSKAGVVSGTSTQTGVFAFTAQVTDSSSPGKQTASVSLVANVQAVPSALLPSFFNMSINQRTSPWPTKMGAKLGGVRLMTATMKWSDLNIAQGVYDWSNFDTWLSTTQANGQDVLFTVYNTPAWASSNPTAVCAATTGGCYPPLDLNADGTGTNQHFKDFVSALIKHAGAGKIKYLEIWNEPNITTEWMGTYAQLVRMAKDAYTVAKGIDPKILISSPPETGDGKNSLYMNWLGNFLAAGGGQYVDTIDFHGYAYKTAEDLAVRINNLRAITTIYGQQSKPVFDTEGSWGVFSKMTDPDQQAAFVGRQYLLQIASQINRFYFFGWDYGNTGDLYNTSNGKLTLAGIAYQQIYQWMQGATPTAPCKASGAVWTCNFTRPNGYQAMAVWNSSQTCLNTLCTTLQFTVPIGYIQYRDLSGTLKTVTGSQIPLGLKPILFENKSAW